MFHLISNFRHQASLGMEFSSACVYCYSFNNTQLSKCSAMCCLGHRLRRRSACIPCACSLVSHRIATHFQSAFEHLAAESALKDRALGTWNVAHWMIIDIAARCKSFNCCWLSRIVSLHVPQKKSQMIKAFATLLATVQKIEFTTLLWTFSSRLVSDVNE
jgi:hypothetical protein